MICLHVFLSFLVISLSFCVEAKPSFKEQDDAYEATKRGIQEYFRTRETPPYLKEALKTFQLTHLFRPTYDDVNAFESEPVCGICHLLVDLIIAQKYLGTQRDEFVSEVTFVCTMLGIETEEVCRGTIDANVDIFMYIIDKHPELGGKDVCNVILNNYNCDIDNEVDWTIEIPKKSVADDKPVPSGVDGDIHILQISDFHYDNAYTPGKNADCAEPICCQANRPDPTDGQGQCGYWAEYKKSDIPWHTVLELIRQVKTHDVDYIYYTGDVISHKVWETSVANNTEDISKVYQKFRESFSVPVYPILGNHEPHPVNAWSSQNETFSNLSTSTGWLYELVAEEWSAWLPEDTKATILQGGFYTVSPQPGFRIVVLNSNVCYTFNWWLIDTNVDPYGQLSWLVKTLLLAEENEESVHILSHVPSGSHECLHVWSREYNRIVERFAGVITGQFNGHTHVDQFALYYSQSDPTKPVSVAFNGASVVPYQDSNPSYKIYSIAKGTFTINDIDEWTFNLTLANLNGDAQPDWYKLYSFKDTYGLQSLDPVEIDSLVLRMAQNHSLINVYDQFKHRLSDTASKILCDDACQKKTLCEIVSTVNGDLEQCNRITEIYESSRRN